MKKAATPLEKEHFIQNFSRLFKLAYESLFNNIFRSITTIVLVAISLAIPMIFYTLYINAVFLTDQLNDSCQISLYLNESATDETAKSLLEEVEDINEVKSAILIDKKEGLEEFSKTFGFIEPITEEINPLPYVISVIPKENIVRDENLIKKLFNDLIKFDLVEQGKYDLEWIQRLSAIGSLLRNIGIVLGLVLFAGIILIISNAIRIDVLQHREEIVVMKIFGATNFFVMIPYLLISWIVAVISSCLAWWITEFFDICVISLIDSISELYQTNFKLVQFSFIDTVIMVFISSILCLSSSYIQLKKMLYQSEHFY